jgi:hypothetical protein
MEIVNFLPSFAISYVFNLERFQITVYIYVYLDIRLRNWKRKNWNSQLPHRERQRQQHLKGQLK